MEEEINAGLKFLRESMAISRSGLPAEERIIQRRKLIASYFSQKAPLRQTFLSWVYGKKTESTFSDSVERFACYVLLGRDLEEAGHLDEALEAYAKVHAYDGMARVYLKVGQRENALALLKCMEQGGRVGPEALLLEAEIRGEFGEYSEVTRLLKLAFCRTPEDNRMPGIYQQIRELGERFAVPVPARLST